MNDFICQIYSKWMEKKMPSTETPFDVEKTWNDGIISAEFVYI